MTLILSSRAPLEKLIAYRKRMGWSLPWVSTAGSDFHRELGFLHTAEELKPARVEPLAADLATAEGVATVEERARGLEDIELLVNNAGLSTSGHFLEQSPERELQSIRVNVEALYSLTRAMVPGMVARKRGGEPRGTTSLIASLCAPPRGAAPRGRQRDSRSSGRRPGSLRRPSPRLP